MVNAYFLLDENEVGEVEVKLMEIKAVDETFKYSIYKRKEGGYLLIIRCSSKDEAHRRALWLRDKVFNNEKLYWVSSE